MALPFALFRSGTSRGPYVRLDRLLGSPAARDAAVAALIGSGTPNHVGGLGGNSAVTCKACLVGPPEAAPPSRERPDHDVRYLFRQVRVAEPSVDASHGDCGNMIAAVGAFALEEGLVAGAASARVLSGAEAAEAVAAAEDMEPTSRAVVVLSESTGVRFEIVVPLLRLPHGLEAVDYRGLRHPRVHVDGLPGSAAGVAVKSQRPQGGTLGRLLPTGRAIDDLGEVRASCVDCSRPLVIVDRAEIQALAPVPDWSPAGITANRGLLDALERVRLAAAERMGMGDARGRVSPKICVVGRGFGAEEHPAAALEVRYLVSAGSGGEAHPSLAMTAGQALAVACLLEGTVAARHFEGGRAAVSVDPGSGEVEWSMGIAHPLGVARFTVNLLKGGQTLGPGADGGADAERRIRATGYVTTVAPICRGVAFVDQTAS